MSVSINGTGGITFADASTQSTGGYTGFRNRIINGACMIAQRGTSFSINSTGTYTLDRWATVASGTAATFAQVAGIGGFKNALQITGASGNTLAGVYQRIEATNIYDLAGQTVTISFTASTSSAQTIGVQLNYPSAIDNWSSNTAFSWNGVAITTTPTRYSITVTLDANCVNGLSIQLGTGALTSGTITITGVQLEKGSVATPFEYRPYGTELALCQRYARTIGNGLSGIASATTSVVFNYSFEQPMRASPTATVTDTSILVSDQYFTDITSTSSAITLSNQSSVGGRLGVNGFTGLTQGRFYSPIDNTNGSVFLLSAEL